MVQGGVGRGQVEWGDGSAHSTLYKIDAVPKITMQHTHDVDIWWYLDLMIFE